MNQQKIFFSYSRADGSDFALKLAIDLKKKGFDVWIDQEDIRAGSEWDIEIEKALETCDFLLFIETEKSVTSNNVLDEVYYALEQHKKVIPIILKDSKTPFRLKRLQHVNFSEDYDAGLTLLINELESNTSTPTYPLEERQPLAKSGKSFLGKYSVLALIIVCLVIITAGVVLYIRRSNNTLTAETTKVPNEKIENKPDAIADQQVATPEPEAPVEMNAMEAEVKNKKNVPPRSSNKNSSNAVSGAENKTIREVNDADLNETLAGDWELVDIDPKPRLKRGYLKIEALDENKVSIKSHLQFYYPQANGMSYLVVFNAFAGCSSCILSTDMKLTAEDISIGSRTIKTLKQDQPDGGKAGDTIMDANANKSIRAAVALHFINNKTAVIKVQSPNANTLEHELTMAPFVYSFRFKKSE